MNRSILIEHITGETYPSQPIKLISLAGAFESVFQPEAGMESYMLATEVTPRIWRARRHVFWWTQPISVVGADQGSGLPMLFRAIIVVSSRPRRA